MILGLLLVYFLSGLVSICQCGVLKEPLLIRRVRSPLPYPRGIYTPAPPGETPACAKNGETFCENISDYPGDVIYKLFKNPKLDYKKFFVSETEDDVPAHIKSASIPNELPEFEHLGQFGMTINLQGLKLKPSKA